MTDEICQALQNICLEVTSDVNTNEGDSPCDEKFMDNPVGWLQEWCMSHRCFPPLYEAVQVELPPKGQFTIACQVLKHREVGSGVSKKLAKKMATLKMCRALHNLSPQVSCHPSTNQVGLLYDNKPMNNPVGWLQQLCMSRQWPLPLYETVHKMSPKEPFTIACKLRNYREVGTGTSKKLAKRMAAEKMCRALQNNTPGVSNIPQDLEENVDAQVDHKIFEALHLQDIPQGYAENEDECCHSSAPGSSNSHAGCRM